MRRLRRILVAILFAVASWASDSLAADASIEISANRNTIYVGEPVVLTVKVSGLDNPRIAPDLTAITNCTMKLLGSRSDSHYSVVIVNGRITRDGFSGRVFQYELTPASAGLFKAGPVSITVDGKTLSAEGPSIQVTGIEKQEWVEIDIKASSESVLVDEPFDITLSIMIKRLPAQYAEAVPLDPNDPPGLTIPFMELNTPPTAGLEVPDLKAILNAHLVSRSDAPGFSMNSYKIDNSPMNIMSMFNMNTAPVMAKFIFDQQVILTNGSSYFKYTLKLNYTPKEENSFTFGPVIFKGPVVTGVDQNGQGVKHQIFAVGPAATVRVVPPPDETRPPSYIGAIGTNIIAEAAIDTQTCKVGDPIKLTLAISGGTRLENITPPLLDLQSNITRYFKIYEDSVHTTTKDGRKVFEYTIRPTTAGTLEFPPIDISYFDSSSRSYKTIRTLPIPVRANESQEIGAANIIQTVTNQASEAVKASEQDARVVAPIDIRQAGAEPDKLTLLPWEFMVLTGSPLAYLFIAGACLLARRFRVGQGRRLRLDSVREAISSLRGFDKSCTADPANAPQVLCAAIKKYLANKFGAIEAGITPQDARKLLKDNCVAPAMATDLCDILERNFNSAYSAGTSGSHSIGDDGRKALALITEIEQATKISSTGKSGNSTTMLILLISAFSTLSLPNSAHAANGRGMVENPVEFQFMWNEANAKMSSAATPDDFQVAASVYQKLADAGVRNGIVFYNMGTALLKAKQYDAALGALLRAERYQGSNDDIRQNMLLAIATRDRNPTPMLPWYRVPLFWHYNLPTSKRIALAVYAFAGFWFALTLRTLGSKLIYKPLLSISLILLAVFGSSVATSFHQEQLDSRTFTKVHTLSSQSTSDPAPAATGKPQVISGGKP